METLTSVSTSPAKPTIGSGAGVVPLMTGGRGDATARVKQVLVPERQGMRKMEDSNSFFSLGPKLTRKGLSDRDVKQ